MIPKFRKNKCIVGNELSSEQSITNFLQRLTNVTDTIDLAFFQMAENEILQTRILR